MNQNLITVVTVYLMNTMTDIQNYLLVFEHRKAGTVAADEKQ